MQAQTPRQAVIRVTVLDVHGIGAGASGAAAGLLHPYTPKGKLTWLGAEAFAAAQRMVSIAEQAHHQCPRQSVAADDGPGAVAYRHGILRVGGNAKQSWELTTNLQAIADGGEDPGNGQSLSRAAVLELVPGVTEAHVAAAQEWPRRRRRERPAARALRARGVPLPPCRTLSCTLRPCCAEAPIPRGAERNGLAKHQLVL